MSAQYLLSPPLMKGLLERQDIYAKLEVLLTKEGGQTVFRRGEIPHTVKATLARIMHEPCCDRRLEC